MKGHLLVKELETYKKADIQKLARELGVSDEGTIKEIAARCAAVEVDIPDEELTEEEQEKLAAEQAAREKAEAAAEQAAKEVKEKAEALRKEKEEAEKAAGRVKVEVTERYSDKLLNRIKEVGEAFYVEESRAAELMEKNVVKIKV